MYDSILTNAVWEVFVITSKKYSEVFGMIKVEILLLSVVIVCLGILWGGTYFSWARLLWACFLV
jgi:hypothetical protein